MARRRFVSPLIGPLTFILNGRRREQDYSQAQGPSEEDHYHKPWRQDTPKQTATAKCRGPNKNLCFRDSIAKKNVSRERESQTDPPTL